MAQPADDRSYGQSAHLYDLFDRKENVDFFYHYAAPAGEVLDVGAGTGRIALPLAERGVSVWCVEPSPAMRRQFEDKLARRPALRDRIRLLPGEARSFELGRTFPAALLSGCFDHFLDDAERLASLANVGRHLQEGGLLVFDLAPGPARDRPLSPAGRAQAGGREIRRFVASRTLPGGLQEVNLLFEVYEDGHVVERIEECGHVGLTDRAGVQRLLRAAGFEVRREWGAYDFRPYHTGDALLIVEARKQGAAHRA
jgi:SAM-dependent methyltransferase